MLALSSGLFDITEGGDTHSDYFLTLIGQGGDGWLRDSKCRILDLYPEWLFVCSSALPSFLFNLSKQVCTFIIRLVVIGPFELNGLRWH